MAYSPKVEALKIDILSGSFNLPANRPLNLAEAKLKTITHP